eukprot:CAMPEP_0172391002 /NCGR_PEP_ID=MMETSP1061-20121228/7520_1 /TAXON_ID=37318 /ORGANISM="Pseudo-nitzschia pungens, Strain cf. pungens" /LENGTH=1432 /DNA_ID=CAMNT_0013121523 /DNA_START=196 /DNA_END=4491 /DNA_ORIENTATION=-
MLASQMGKDGNSNGNESSHREELDLPLPLPVPFPEDAIGGETDCGRVHDCNGENDATVGESLLKRFRIEQGRNDDGDDNDDNDGNDDDGDENQNDHTKLDRLPPDVFVLLCCNLAVGDIASLALCSKALYVASNHRDLWRQKFIARWNYDDPTIVDWFSAYRQAYFNPHDLWITHWNCVDPCDGLGPGRCCIRDERLEQQRKIARHKTKRISPNNASQNQHDNPRRSSAATNRHEHRCPKCRYHPCLDTNNNGDGDGEREPPISISTTAQAIEAATNLRLEESSHMLPCSSYSPNVATRAFTKASTLHRSLDHRQYQVNALYFLEDLLFFHVHDDHNENSTDDEPVEMKDWKDYIRKRKRSNTNAHRDNHPGGRRANDEIRDRDRDRDDHEFRDCDELEPALHSWHLANVCNPNHNRPIVWRISVQRPDCFTVFPSEGYLLPGESKVVTFGVTPLGSLMAHATQQLNIHREAADEFWANLYDEESHLPCTPYLFHYHFAPSVPCRPVDNDHLSPFQRYQRQQRQQQEAARPPLQPDPNPMPNSQRLRHPRTSNACSPWDQSSGNPAQPIRTFLVAGHVHANYSLSAFRRKTLVPWQLPRHLASGTEHFIKRYLPQEQQPTYSMSPVVFCSPQLMEFYPVEWQRLQALQMEEQCNNSVFASRYRTEPPCSECGLTWGPRMEELGQAYVLAKLESEATHRRHLDRFRCIYRILMCLVKQHKAQQQSHCVKKSRCWTARNQQVVKCLRRKVTNYRGTPWLSAEESQVLLQWEFLLDVLSRSTSSVQPSIEKTRKISSLPCGELYRYPTCTDSIFNQKAAFDSDVSNLYFDPKMASWKSEPRHLETFSCLAHSPGRFCFPHQTQTRFKTDDKRDPLTLTECEPFESMDLFLNNHFAGLKAALSVFADPRSLLTHGLFDKVPYPGSVFRRCKLPVLPGLDEKRCLAKVRRRYQKMFHSFISSQKQLAYYELQESLDVQGLLIVNSIVTTKSHDLNAVPYPISVRNFMRNIPSPGNGRFALSVDKCDGGHLENILGSDEFWFLKKHLSEVREYNFEGKIDVPISSMEIAEESQRGQQWPVQEAFPPPGDGFDLRDAAGMNNAMLPRGPRMLSILWMLSAQLGWTVDSNESTNSVYVDRRILIAAHWLSITLAFFPLLVTLLARYLQYIPATPTSYHLDGLPYSVENKMRFLTEKECLQSSVALLVFYCMLGRWVERYICRDFLRTMKEHTPVAPKCNIFYQLYSRILHGGERAWDAVCPLFLQRLTFLANCNRRKPSELMNHVSYWRSQESKERGSTFRAVGGRGGIFFEEQGESLNLDDHSTIQKVFAGITMVLVGFTFGSPHFFLNFLTVFPCSVGLGASTSLHSIEAGRSRVTASSTGSFIESFSLVTIIMFGLLIGQLVGSSGGVLFLVEFAITSMSLLLGGMGTISASGMETW